MKKISALIVFAFLLSMLLGLNLVISEVFYNPEGSDGDNEWLELYNPTDEVIHLQGWQIQTAGSSFETVHTFNIMTSVQPHSYFLIGEQNVDNSDVTTDLNMQNGGNATDGVRIFDGNSYYDTVLYDQPNENNLENDIGAVDDFSLNVEDGNSLARKNVSFDSNSASDFAETSLLSPGSANLFPVDIAILSLSVEQTEEIHTLSTVIQNLSTIDVNNNDILLEISINDEVVKAVKLPELGAGQTIDYQTEIEIADISLQIISVEILYNLDINTENNILSTSIIVGESPLVINEIVYNPIAPKPEWIELYNRSEQIIDLQRVTCRDGSDNLIAFDGTIAPDEYLVILQYESQLQTIYPEIDAAKVIVADAWAALNNSGDELVLLFEDSMLDSMSYSDFDIEDGQSLERVNPFAQSEFLPSISASGATPTYANSLLPQDYDLEIISLPIQEEVHQLIIRNIGIYDLTNFHLKIFEQVDDLAETLIYDSQQTITDSVNLLIESSIAESGYVAYKYKIENEDDLVDENNISYQFIANNTISFCVNEIMPDPIADEPEWMEIRKNIAIEAIDSATLIVDSDTLQIELNNDFILITCSQEDSLFLSEIVNCPIFYGLNGLSNEGEQIQLYDKSNNLIENFVYDGSLVNAKGNTIERIVPTLVANSENWGESGTASPGAENILFTEFIPTKIRLKINPKTFSPYRNEHTVIECTLPEILNKITFRIFDMKGRAVRKLVDQQIDSANGAYIWDGKDEDGRNLNSGVYIILMEATSLHNSKVFREKITCVIGH